MLGPIGRNLGPLGTALLIMLSVIPSFRVCHLGQHVTGSLLRLFSSFIPSFRVYRILLASVSALRLLYPEYLSAAYRRTVPRMVSVSPVGPTPTATASA
jgi:hypothetical protein